MSSERHGPWTRPRRAAPRDRSGARGGPQGHQRRLRGSARELPKPHKLWLHRFRHRRCRCSAIGIYSIYGISRDDRVIDGVGQQQHGVLGLGHHELRVVDRNRPRRHADDLRGSPLSLTRQQLAHRGINRAAEAMTIFAVMAVPAHVPAAPHRPAVVRVVDWIPLYPNDMGSMWPQLPQPAGCGTCSRSRPTSRSSVAVLVSWAWSSTSRRSAIATSSAATTSRRSSYGIFARLARLGAAVAPLRARVPDPRRPRDAAGVQRPLGRVLRLRDVAATGWHMTIFLPYFVASTPSSPASRWC